jgi:hypothetical protein
VDGDGRHTRRARPNQPTNHGSSGVSREGGGTNLDLEVRCGAGHGGGAGVPGAGRSADPGRHEVKGGSNDGRKEGEGSCEVKEIGGLDLGQSNLLERMDGGRDGCF